MTIAPMPAPATSSFPAAPTVPTGTAPTAPLRDALMRAAAIAPRRDRNVLFTHTLLRAAGRELNVLSQAPGLLWHERVPATDLPDFDASAPASKLGQIAALLTDADTHIGPSRARAYGLDIHVPDIDMLFSLEGIDPNGYELPIHDGITAVPSDAPCATVSARELADAIKCVKYAASKEAFQRAFRGICLGGAGGNEVAASDGYRLAVYTLSSNLPYAILPLPIAERIMAAFARLPQDVDVRMWVTAPGALPQNGSGPIPAQQLLIQAGPHTVSVLCINDQYPDYGKVMNVGGLSAAWGRKALLRRLQGLAIVFNPYASNRIELTQRGTVLTLEADWDDMRAQTTLQMTEPLGGRGVREVSAAYNLRYLREAAHFAPEDELRVAIQYDDSQSRSLEIRSGNYCALIVSLRE